MAGGDVVVSCVERVAEGRMADVDRSAKRSGLEVDVVDGCHGSVSEYRCQVGHLHAAVLFDATGDNRFEARRVGDLRYRDLCIEVLE